MGGTYGTNFGIYKNGSGGSASTTISYVRYDGRFQPTQYLLDDLAWYNTFTTFFNYAVVGVRPILDKTNERKLLTLNFWGNLDRATNDAGGVVFDGSDGSTPSYLVDNYTGLGWYLQSPIAGNANWADSNSTIQSLTLVGYTAWRMPAKFDIINILTTNGGTNLLVDNGASFTKDIHFLLDSNSATDVAVWTTGGAEYLSSTQFQLANPTTAYTTTNAIICRNHF